MHGFLKKAAKQFISFFLPVWKFVSLFQTIKVTSLRKDGMSRGQIGEANSAKAQYIAVVKLTEIGLTTRSDVNLEMGSIIPQTRPPCDPNKAFKKWWLSKVKEPLPFGTYISWLKLRNGWNKRVERGVEVVDRWPVNDDYCCPIYLLSDWGL